MYHPHLAEICDALKKATISAFTEAECVLPPDVREAIRRSAECERDPVAQQELKNILDNVEIAASNRVPICQDTGVPVCYLTLPPQIPFCNEILEAIGKGVEEATELVPLRPNVVDPCTRENRGKNVGAGMPLIHVSTADCLSITAFPKGAGSENLSRIAMLLPAERERIVDFVVETMLIAGGRPCPPVILGVGIGSTFEGVAALAKLALLEPVTDMDPFERALCDAVNRLGIGPMGLGGETTALAVKVKRADCHTASLPVAVNVQCWACRRARVVVEGPF
ncbi:MAG: fumarate hydratase [Methanomicrobiales archaeon]|nr:fumarate hydratase [Methanomicrobiales archaeon]